MINNRFHEALVGNASMFDRPEGEESIEPTRFVVISAEGVRTEPSYFLKLSELLKDNHVALRFLVLEHKAGQNTPERLVEQLRECRELPGNDSLTKTMHEIIQREFPGKDMEKLLDEKRKITKGERERLRSLLLPHGIDIDFHRFVKQYSEQFDVFAAVLDRDSDNHSQDSLQKAYDLCTKEKFRFCMTNPCFEFWLFLHLSDGKDLSEETRKNMAKSSSFMKTYLSRRTHHREKLPQGTFDAYYAGAIPEAIWNANNFATEFQDILHRLGTNLGVFFSSLEKEYDFQFCQLAIPDTQARLKKVTGSQTGSQTGGQKGVQTGTLTATPSEKTSERTSEKIVKLLKDTPQITSADLAVKLHVSSRAIEYHLQKLKESGKVKRIGSDRSGHWEIVEK